MKNYSLYFLSLILTFGFWASPSFAQDGFEIAQNHQIYSSLKKVDKTGPIAYSAEKARYANSAATYVEIYDQNGDYVCTAQEFTPHAQYDNVVVASCGEYVLTAYLNINGLYNQFVYSLFEDGTQNPFATATHAKMTAENDIKPETQPRAFENPGTKLVGMQKP